MKISRKERFLRYVKITPNCWEWQGAIHYRGYGHFQWSHKKTERAHRAAWMLFKGEIPKKMYICHHCDNTKCVRINHLFLGTPFDNVQDQKIKGRLKKVRGPEHYRWNPALHYKNYKES